MNTLPGTPSSSIEAATLLRDIARLEEIISGWDEQKRNTVAALKRAIDDLNKEAFTRLIRTVKANPEAKDSLREAARDEVVYAVLRHHELIKASQNERIEEALQSVRPFLKSHGGDVELVSLDAPNRVTIRLIGACDGCPASGLTLSEGVEKAIKQFCPEITEIHKARGGASAKPVNGTTVHFVSPFARNTDTGWVYAAELDEIPEAGIKSIDLAGQSVLLSRSGDRVTCFQNACAHLGMPLDMGTVRDGILECPYHGFQYALDSGECLTASQVQLQAHAARVSGNRVEVRVS